MYCRVSAFDCMVIKITATFTKWKHAAKILREKILTHTWRWWKLHFTVRFPCLFINFLVNVVVVVEEAWAMLMILVWKLSGKFGVLKDMWRKKVTTISCRLIISFCELLSKVISRLLWKYEGEVDREKKKSFFVTFLEVVFKRLYFEIKKSWSILWFL